MLLQKRQSLLQTKEDDLLGSCRTILRAIPGAQVCAHYSLKWNYRTNVERSYEAFRRFCTDMAALDGHAAVMLVSGGGKKRKLDTVAVCLCLTENILKCFAKAPQAAVMACCQPSANVVQAS